MKTKTAKKPAAKTTKPKNAAAIRDLPAKKDARGGIKFAAEEHKK